MSRETCIAALKAEGIELDSDQLDMLADSLEATIENARSQNRDVYEAVQEALDDYIDQADALVNTVKRNAHLNNEAQMKIQSYIDEHWADAPAEGMRTLLTGVQADRPGAKDAVAVLQQQLADKYIGDMTSRLNTVGPDGRKPMDFVKPKAFGGTNPHSAEVFKIMYHMNQENPDPAMWHGKPPSMVKAAEILLEAQETTRKDANASGSFEISKLDNRVVRRTHDMYKMQEVGFDEWKADMESWGAKELSDISDENWDDVVRRHYNQTVSGERVMNPDAKPETNSLPGGMGNISKSMTHARVFKFKGVDEELAYFQKYGRGDLLENVVFGLELSAQRIGLMRRFGPNAKANFQKVADRIGTKLSKAEDTAKYKKFRERMKTIEKMHWSQVDGSIFVPGNAAVAKAGQWYRTIKMMALLGKAVLTSVVDIAIYASEVRYQGGSYLGGMFEAIGGISKGVFGKRDAATNEVLASLGVIADNMRNSTLSRFDPDRIIAGGSSKMAEIFFNLNLLTPWTDQLRTTFALSRSHALSLNSRKSFKSLSPEWQRILRQFNIKDNEWDVIKAGSLKEADGRKYITPEGLRDLDDKVIAKYLEAEGLPVNPSNITKYRTEIADRFRSYFHSRAHTAALEPDAGTRAMMLMGTRAGTPEGETVRMIGMFKSFPAAYIRQVMGREMLGHRSDLPTGMDKLGDPTAMMNMAKMISISTMFGALAMYLKAMVDGKEPPDITEENWNAYLLRAMLEGGALSFYGDFLIGEAKNRYGGNILTSFMGPIAQDIAKVEDIRAKMMSEDPEVRDAGADALNWLFRNVPGSNLFYTKAAYDYLVIYNLMEMTDPGSLQRMEQRKQREMEQTYFIPPSTVIPPGGGMPNF